MLSRPITQMLFSAGHTGGTRFRWYVCVDAISNVKYLHAKSASSCSPVTLYHSNMESGKDECSQSEILRMDKE